MKEWKIFPLQRLFVVMLLLGFVIALSSNVESSMLRALLSSFRVFCIQYLVFFLGFAAVKSTHDIDEFVKKLIWVAIPLCVIGLICFFKQENFIDISVSNFNGWGNDVRGLAIKASVERGFRVLSTQYSPNVFGLICTYLIILLYFNITKLNKITSSMIIGILTLNLLLCGTRMPAFVLMVGVLVYFIIQKGRIKSILTFAGLLLVLLLILHFMDMGDKVSLYVNNIINTLTGEKKVGGSSLEMRLTQFYAVIPYFLKHPLVGSGLGSFNAIQLGRYLMYDPNLFGAESYLFYVLIEEGLLKLGLVIIFYYRILSLFLKNKKTPQAKIAIILTICSMVYLLTSHPNTSFLIFMPLLGMYAKHIFLMQRRGA